MKVVGRVFPKNATLPNSAEEAAAVMVADGAALHGTQVRHWHMIIQPNSRPSHKSCKLLTVE